MYKNTSAQFNNLIKQSGRTFRARMLVDGNVLEGFFNIKISAGSNNGDALTLGSTISQNIDVTMEKPTISLRKTEFQLQMGLKLDEETIEYVPVGYFTPDEIKEQSGKLTFKAYDRMLKLSPIYKSTLPLLTSTIEMLHEITAQTGVDISTTGLSDMPIINKKGQGYTCREILMYIAQMYGCFAVVNRNGVIELKFWEESGHVIDHDLGINAFTYDDEFTVKSLTCTIAMSAVDGNPVNIVHGSGEGIAFFNPVMRQAAFDAIYEKVNGFSYSPVECSFRLGDPRLDPWDIVTVVDLGGTEYKVPLMSVTYTYDGGLSCSIKSTVSTESEISYDYKGPKVTSEQRFLAQIAAIEELTATKISAEDLDAEVAKIGYLKVTEADLKYATITALNVTNAEIKSLSAKAITTDNISAKVAELGYLEAETAYAAFLAVDDFNAFKAYVDEFKATTVTTDIFNARIGEINALTSELILADEIFAEDLAAFEATIEELSANVVYAEHLNAHIAELGYVHANSLETEVASITRLFAEYTKTTELEANYATIDSLNATNAKIDTVEANAVKTSELDAKVAALGYVTAETVEAGYATIESLNATKAYAESLQADIARIDEAYVNEAEVNTLIVNKGYITEAEVNDLVADYATIESLDAANARIDNLSSIVITTENLSANVATLGYLKAEAAETTYATIANLSATNANITTLSGELSSYKTTVTEKLSAQDASIESLQAKDVSIEKLVADKADIDELEAVEGRVDTLETTTLKTSDLSAEVAKLGYATVESLDAAKAKITALETNTVKTNELESKVATFGYLKTSDLEASVADFGYLKANTASLTYATITSLEAVDASLKTLSSKAITTDNLSAKVATLGYLKADDLEAEVAEFGYLKTATASANYATITNLSATNQNVTNLTSKIAAIDSAYMDEAKVNTLIVGYGYITTAETNNLLANYATIDLANVKAGSITSAMIGTGVVGTAQIADGSITDAKIVGLTANKITAGTLDAGTIEVINLNAANITVGTINGQQIASGAIDTSKLASSLSSTINTASNNASQALSDAANAQSTADTAKSNAAAAQSTANTAKTNAATAQATADGKNTVFYQTSQPSASGRKTNDIWFDTDDGNKMYYWNGSTWTAKQFGTNAIANTSITNALIADATIQSAKIANLDAAKITTGTLSADRIAASSITAAKIASNAITADKLSAGAITTAKLASEAVTADKIISGAITTDKLAANAVTANNILAGAVTADKIAVTSLEAIVAKIGGFDIGNTYLANSTTSLGGAENSVYVGTDGISCGTAFKVKKDGTLSATDAEINGSIEANQLYVSTRHGFSDATNVHEFTLASYDNDSGSYLDPYGLTISSKTFASSSASSADDYVILGLWDGLGFNLYTTGKMYVETQKGVVFKNTGGGKKFQLSGLTMEAGDVGVYRLYGVNANGGASELLLGENGAYTISKDGGSYSGNSATATTLVSLTASITELNYCDGVTSNIQTQLNGKAASNHSHSGYAASSHTHSYVPLAGGDLTNGAKLKFTLYGTRSITITGNSIDADMSADTGTWAGNFATVKDSKGDTTAIIGWYGSYSGGLTHIFMGGTYNDPAMKMTKAGQFTFKNTPYVGTKLVSLADHTHDNYAASTHTHSYLALNGGTITGTSGDTPLYVKSASTGSYIGFRNNSGSILGYFGFSAANTPVVYMSSAKKILHEGNYSSYCAAVGHTHSEYAAVSHAHSYLPLSGGTLTGELLLSTGTTQSATKGIKWSAINSKNPYIGYATDQIDGTFVVASLLGTAYATGLAIGGGSGNLLYKGNVVLNASNYNSYAAKVTHNHAASEIASGTLDIKRGGTGITANPSMLINLSSTSAADVFASSPRPGVKGTLPVVHGGTGSTTAVGALTNLGVITGTWTPTVPNARLTNAVGFYMKVGNMVTIQWYVTGTGESTNQSMFTIKGIPYNADTTPLWQGGGGHCQGCNVVNAASNTYGAFTGYVLQGSDNTIYARAVVIYTVGSGTGTYSTNAGNYMYLTGGTFHAAGSITYKIAE